MLKTKDGRLLDVEELNLREVVNIIAKINPNLAKTMNLLDDGLNYTFYKASYRFGDRIINNGKCYLPLMSGGSISFDDPELPDTLRNDLSYDKEKKEEPLGIALNKNSEFYLLGKNGVQTQSILHPGQVFGVPRATDANANNNSTSVLESNLNAGSRLLFMLSKISDKIGHAKIQEHYEITMKAPATQQDHWALFVEIANKSDCKWRSEIIYFPRKLISQLKNIEWAALANCLMHTHRASYNIGHRVTRFWNQAFHEIENDKQLARFYSMQSIETAKELFRLAAGITYGFKPATNNNSAPISLIVDTYTNVYNQLGKQNHLPIIMESAKFDLHNSKPIYYSINHLVSTRDDLEASRKKSQIARLDEIQRVESWYTGTILGNKDNVPPSLYDVASSTKFTYYHTDSANYNKINNAALLATEDTRFTNGECETFPTSSLFFKGCIKISRANTDK